MTCTVIVEFQATPEGAAEFARELHDALRVTRNYDGNMMCEELHNQDDPCGFVVFQKWISREKQEAYLKWRAESGTADHMGDLLVGDPTFRIFIQIPKG
jgi:quinol monooxygenase YgiN